MFRGVPTWKAERHLWAEGCRLVAGVDEVGRGPLAGPVVAAAVVLAAPVRGWARSRVRDSKQLTPAARERLDPQIRRAALGAAVGVAEAAAIDAAGIVEATRLAMARAVRRLDCGAEHLLVDALALSVDGIPCTPVVHGDVLCYTIAAASIVAKVARDRMMVDLDARHPGYGFARHKGYPTPQHLAALDLMGPSPEHRRGFAPVRRVLERTA